jgi:hypothetical protein
MFFKRWDIEVPIDALVLFVSEYRLLSFSLLCVLLHVIVISSLLRFLRIKSFPAIFSLLILVENLV